MEIGSEGDNTKLYFSTANTLYWPNGAMTINPFRAYFQLNSAAATRSVVLNFGDETTGIVELKNSGIQESKSDTGWYTLDGRRLNGKPTTKGLYIHNGQKTVIK